MYLSIKNVSGYILKENDEKFLFINDDNLKSNKYYLLFSALKNLIANEGDRKGQFISFNDGYKKIEFLSDDDTIPDELLYFNELIVVIKCVFRQEYILYPQVYLESVKYELYK